jgi:hypothetical protein
VGIGGIHGDGLVFPVLWENWASCSNCFGLLFAWIYYCVLERKFKEKREWIMFKEDLSKFCRNDGFGRIDHPWSVGDKTYVTNGYVLLRLSRLKDVSENKDAPDASKLFEDFPFPSGPLHPIPDLPEPEYEVCDVCDGTGRGATKGGPSDCIGCDGKARFETFKYFGIDGIQFQVFLLRLIKTLSGIEISINKTPGSPSWIRFEGGDGLIMPCRQIGGKS